MCVWMYMGVCMHSDSPWPLLSLRVPPSTKKAAVSWTWAVITSPTLVLVGLLITWSSGDLDGSCVPLTSMLLHVERWEFSTAGVLLWVSQIHGGLGWDRAATYAFQAYISPTECSSWPRWTAFGNLQVNTLLYIQIYPPLKTPGDMCQVNTVFSSFSGSRTYKGQHAILLFS